MNTEIQKITKYGTLAEYGIQESQMNILKEKICPNAPLEELVYFCSQAVKRNLNPLTGQVWLVERWDSSKNKMGYSIQTGIAGLRAIADRTGKYTPSEISPKFEYDNSGKLISCTAFVKKYAKGNWHQVSATAYYDEFVALKKDKTPNKFWSEKPRLMLEKCAEALALRKAFPDELAGLYTPEEMSSSPVQFIDTSKATLGDPEAEVEPWNQPETKQKISAAQVLRLKAIMSAEVDKETGLAYPLPRWTNEQAKDYTFNKYGVSSAKDLTTDIYDEVCKYFATHAGHFSDVKGQIKMEVSQ